METTKWTVIDLEGTLSDFTHRISLIPDWQSFNDKFIEDRPYENICRLARIIGAGNPTLIITTRSIGLKPPTEKWLKDNHIPYDELLMRPQLYFASDPEAKWTMLSQWAGSEEDALNSIWLIIEDNEKTVEFLRNKGLTVLQPRLGEL